MKRLSFLLLISSLALILSCDKDNVESIDETVNEYYSNNKKITLINPVMRPSAKGMNSAIYLSVRNNTSSIDTLYGVETDIAELVEIHETFRVNKDKMGMRHVNQVEIQPDTKFELRPGSYHIMLIDLYEDAILGKKVNAKLLFKNAGEIKFTAEVKDLLNIYNK